MYVSMCVCVSVCMSVCEVVSLYLIRTSYSENTERERGREWAIERNLERERKRAAKCFYMFFFINVFMVCLGLIRVQLSN